MALLFVSFATVPVSLTGSGPCLSSRLDSLAKAWSQVAGVFLTVYQPSNAAQLLALEYSNTDDNSGSQQSCSAESIIALNAADIAAELSGVISPEAQPEMALLAAGPSLSQPLTRSTRVQSSAGARRTRIAIPTRVAPGPIKVRRIDLADVMKLAVENEQVKRILNMNLVDYKIETRFELSKMSKPHPMPARPGAVIKRGASDCDRFSEPAPRSETEFRERMKRNNVPLPPGVGVQS
jgi:hypothetical protein